MLVVFERIQGLPGVSRRTSRRTSAIRAPKTIAAGKKNRNLGTPMSKISMLPMANKAPAIPVPRVFSRG